MDVLLPLVGGLVVMIAMLDVFLTVLYPASGHGPIRNWLARAIWRGFRLAGRLTSGQRRRDLLSYSGPVVIGATLLAWLLALVLGWALVYLPALGDGVQANSGATDERWQTAVYFSAMALTTLGVGDVIAESPGYRLLLVAQAATGFIFFSMVITYFLSVYSNLPTRNAAAMKLHQLTGSSGDAAELLARIADGADLSTAEAHLSNTADFVRSTYQSHRFYPVLRYFHYRDSYYALPRILLTALDTVTLLHTALDGARYRAVLESPAVHGLSESALLLMRELEPHVQPGEPTHHQRAVWRLRYIDALGRLERAGLVLCADPTHGAERYVELRASWDRPLRMLADAMLCDWQAIEQGR